MNNFDDCQPNAELHEAIKIVLAAGYRISRVPKPRAPKQELRKLNAIGRPYGLGFDPNYRIKYRTPSISNRQGNMPVNSCIRSDQWPAICAQAEADAIRRGLVDPAKARFNAPAVVAMLVPPEHEYALDTLADRNTDDDPRTIAF